MPTDLSPIELDAYTQDKIRAEEIFRAEVRDALSKKKSFVTRAWEIANSGFVLFFLGSCVLTFGSFAYKRWEQDTAAAVERHRFYAHAFNELNLRAYTAQQALPMPAEVENAKALMADRYLLLVPGTEGTVFAPLFPDFAGRSAVSILKDLQEDCSKFSSCAQVDRALSQIAVVRDIGFHWNDKDYSRQQKLDAALLALRTFRASVELPASEPDGEISHSVQRR